MTESFLHHVWRYRLYRFFDLKTTSGEPIKVIHAGFPHQDAGPDFKQAMIQIGEITWAGNVEIHINSSDWLKHKHQADLKYKSVILHVVFNHDAEIERSQGLFYPTLELKQYISDELLDTYRKFTASQKSLPCLQQLSSLSALQFSSFFSRLVMERLLNKQTAILEILRTSPGGWPEVFFRVLSTNFGFKTNSVPFELLGKSLPYKYIVKHLHVRLQVYALIFGQAGMLEEDKETDDEYYNLLSAEYHYLKYKYRLLPIDKSHWNYLRLRPNNFPCIRLAQLSELLYRFPDIFQKMASGEVELHEIQRLFCINPHSYWQTHFQFGKETKKQNVTLGKESVELLLINTFIPVLFSYATFHGDETLQVRTLSMLEELPFEENSITKFYKKNNFPAKDALSSQAILELKKSFCDGKKCLDCNIGSIIISRQERPPM